MKIDDYTVDKIKESTDIVELISNYIKLRKTGRNYIGLCPFHSEKTPSFSVNEEGQFFHCFGCGEGGDAIEFIRKIENISFQEAVKILGERAGIYIEEDLADTERKDRVERLFKINQLTARFFYKELDKNKKAIEYLKKRGINNKLRKQFGLGYAPDEWDSLIVHLQKNVSKEDLLSLGLIKKSKTGSFYDTFRDRIIFPIIDTKNRVIGFGGRAIGDREPKYLNSPESEIFIKGNHLYGINLVKKYSDKKSIFLVEGYMDVISLFNNGILKAVASLGTSLTEKQAGIVSRYGDDIYILYDSDMAGRKATLRALDVFADIGISPFVINLGNGLDPDDYFKQHSLEDFNKLRENSLTPYIYRINHLREKYNIEIPEEKMKLIKEFLGMIRNVKNILYRDVMLQKFQEDFKVSSEVIKSILGEYRPTKDERIERDIHSKNVPDYLEFQLLKFYVLMPNHCEKFEEKMFQNQEFGQIFHIVEKIRNEKEQIQGKALYENLLKELPDKEDTLHRLFFVNEDFLEEDPGVLAEELFSVLDLRNDFLERELLLNRLKETDLESERTQIIQELITLNRRLKI